MINLLVVVVITIGKVEIDHHYCNICVIMSLVT